MSHESELRVTPARFMELSIVGAVDLYIGGAVCKPVEWQCQMAGPLKWEILSIGGSEDRP